MLISSDTHSSYMLYQCTTLKSEYLTHLLGKEAELEQGRLPSEETGRVYEGSMDEDATHVLPTESRDVERGVAVVDDMVIYFTKCSPPPQS